MGGAALSAANFPAGGGPGSLTLTPDTSCAWSAESSQPFLQISNPSGAGNGTANFTVQPNPGAGPRFATVSALGRMLQIAQAGTSPSDPFADVPLAHPFANHIAEMKGRAITSGCSATTYCPDMSTTRGQMAVFIIRGLFGDTFAYALTPYFTDVPAGHQFFKYIQKMKELGITAGCGASIYCPDATVTRGQMAVFMIRATFGNTFAPASTPEFADVAADDPFRPFINKMREVGITSGCSATQYCPNDPVTRGQMAVFIIRTFFGS